MRKIRLIVIVLAFLPLSVHAQQKMSLGTNAIGYARYGTVNADMCWGFSRHWSVSAGGWYNPFSFRGDYGTVFEKQRSLSLGSRWWPWHVFSGWWLDGRIRWQEYNTGGKGSPETTEGDRYGASLSAGYSYMLSPHVNLDFGAGLWGGKASYTTYACQRCGKITSAGEKTFILPADIMLGVSYVF